MWVGSEIGYISGYLVISYEEHLETLTCFQASRDRAGEHVIGNIENLKVHPFAYIRGQFSGERELFNRLSSTKSVRLPNSGGRGRPDSMLSKRDSFLKFVRFRKVAGMEPETWVP